MGGHNDIPSGIGQLIARLRKLYGAGPLHLLALTASLLIAAVAVAHWLDNTGPIAVRILIWFGGAIVGHDLILLPLYTLLDRLAFGGPHGSRGRGTSDRSAGWVYVRVPTALAALLFLVFFPEILSLGDQTFHTASGLHQDVYLTRYALTCAALFLVSSLAYALHLGQQRRTGRPTPQRRGSQPKPGDAPGPTTGPDPGPGAQRDSGTSSSP